jgi:hypothetical protein
MARPEAGRGDGRCWQNAEDASGAFGRIVLPEHGFTPDQERWQ